MPSDCQVDWLGSARIWTNPDSALIAGDLDIWLPGAKLNTPGAKFVARKSMLRIPAWNKFPDVPIVMAITKVTPSNVLISFSKKKSYIYELQKAYI